MSRAAIFLPDFAVYGGVERVMSNLAVGLGERLQVEIVIAKGFPHEGVPTPRGIPIRSLGCRRTASAIPRLARYLRSERPDVLISAKDHANVVAVAARIAARTQTRVAVTVHFPPALPGSHRAGWSGRVLPSLMRVIYPLADVVAGVSPEITQSLTHDFRIAPTKVALLPNPVVDAELLGATNSPKPHPWLSSSIPVVVCVARLVPEKDVAALIDAIALIRRDHRIRLIVVGDGPERDLLQRRAHDQGIADDTAFVGFTPDPSPFIAHCSVLALTSRLEGFGVVLIEALALKRQVVATDCVTGPRYILDGGRLGRLVPVGDIPALARAIIAAIDDPLPPASEDDLNPFRVEVATARYAEILGLPEWRGVQ